MDGRANFELLRERLTTAEDKTALMHLEMIRMNALEEFRQLTNLGKTLTVDGVTYDAEKRQTMSVEEKERVAFSLGWECLMEAKSVSRDRFLDQDIRLRQLDVLPHCAFLHVLAMIENITDGNGAPQIVTPRYNFSLVGDENHIFRDLIEKMTLFYPEVPIGGAEEFPSTVPKQKDERPVVSQPAVVVPESSPQQIPCPQAKDDSKNPAEKQKTRGKRIVFLILAIWLSVLPIPLLLEAGFREPLAMLMFLGLYGWCPALFWWLYLRKGKGK